MPQGARPAQWDPSHVSMAMDLMVVALSLTFHADHVFPIVAMAFPQ